MQGHPKLIELAEGMAADRKRLTVQVAQGENRIPGWGRAGTDGGYRLFPLGATALC